MTPPKSVPSRSDVDVDQFLMRLGYTHDARLDEVAGEVERLRARVLRLESLGAVTAVAGPLQRSINEAARLLSGALLGHEAGERTFRRGELADLEMALDALHKVRSHA